MLKTPRSYPFADLNKLKEELEYRIGINDIIEITVLTNNAYRLIESDGNNVNRSLVNPINVIVEFDGTIKLPAIGRVSVIGLSQREAELLLEQRYNNELVDPYVRLIVTNRRVTFFPGNGGQARTILLTNQRTTLMEFLALAGGLPLSAKADRIRIIRGNLNAPDVFEIDLRHIDNIAMGEYIIQANDIIYVEPRNDYVANFIGRAGPYLTIINFGIFFYLIFLR